MTDQDRRTPPVGLDGHELIICTRNRFEDLSDCLVALSRSTRSMPILVVDSSDTDASEQVVYQARSGTLAGWPVRFLRSERGLTVQRNVGLDASAAEIVHFIDDDAMVHPNYFENMARNFDDSSVVGAGGVQHHIPPRRTNWLRVLLQVEARPGRISASGVNNLVANPSPRPVPADWVTGCCMAFRADAARRTRFNEGLSGYSLGEDVDFSLRISSLGRLVVDTSARVDHTLSPVNRNTVATNVRDTLRHRWRIISEHPGRLRRSAFWLSVFADGCRYCVGSLLGRETSRQALAGLYAGARRRNPDC